MKGEGKNRKNAECAYAIACSTRKTKHAKKERRTKRKKNRPVSAKSRQETTKRPPLFFQSPHDFFNAYTLRTPRRTKPAQKGGAYSEKWGNATPSALTHRKKNQSSQQKENQSTCLSRIFVLLLPKPTRKTPYISRFSSHFASTCPSPSPCAAHWIGNPSRALPSTSLSRYENTLPPPLDRPRLHSLHPAYCRTH